jgi:hypothetical protein
MKTHDWKKTYWEDNKGNKTTIQEILIRLENEPAIYIKTNELINIRSDIPLEDFRIEHADLSKPIIIVKKGKSFQYILDGNHRLQRAIDEKRGHILSKVLIGDP